MMAGPGLNRTAVAPPQMDPCRIDRPSGQARALGPDGTTTQAWLQTGEACAFTAAASIRTVPETITRSLRAPPQHPVPASPSRSRTPPGPKPSPQTAGTGKALRLAEGNISSELPASPMEEQANDRGREPQQAI